MGSSNVGGHPIREDTMATKPISEIVAETIALNYPSIDGLTQASA